MFDHPHNDDVQFERKQCEESGWRFAVSRRQFQVYCFDGDSQDVPEFRKVSKYYKTVEERFLEVARKQEIAPLIFSILYFVWVAVFVANRTYEVWLTNFPAFARLGLAALMPGVLWNIGCSIIWYMRVGKANKRELPMPKSSFWLMRIRRKAFAICYVVFVVLVTAGAVLDISVGNITLTRAILRVAFVLVAWIAAMLLVMWQVDKKPRDTGNNKRRFYAVYFIGIVIFVGVIISVMPRNSGIISMPPNDYLGGRVVLSLSDVGIDDSVEFTRTRVNGGSLFVPVNYYHREECGADWQYRQIVSTQV